MLWRHWHGSLARERNKKTTSRWWPWSVRDPGRSLSRRVGGCDLRRSRGGNISKSRKHLRSFTSERSGSPLTLLGHQELFGHVAIPIPLALTAPPWATRPQAPKWCQTVLVQVTFSVACVSALLP